jgi:hypothetical protein
MIIATSILIHKFTHGLHHCTSMYADDVVTFFKADRVDLPTCVAMVEDFGEASGLHTNRSKCSLHPIWCSIEQIELACSILQCTVEGWPCKYLGPLLVSIRSMRPIFKWWWRAQLADYHRGVPSCSTGVARWFLSRRPSARVSAAAGTRSV